MTSTEKRKELIRRSDLIVQSANNRLHYPRNVEKGDDWETINIYRLFHLLRQEVAEVEEAALMLAQPQPISTHGALRNNLLLECGDVLNFMRMLCWTMQAFHIPGDEPDDPQLPFEVKPPVLDAAPTDPLIGQMYQDFLTQDRFMWTGFEWRKVRTRG